MSAALTAQDRVLSAESYAVACRRNRRYLARRRDGPVGRTCDEPGCNRAAVGGHGWCQAHAGRDARVAAVLAEARRIAALPRGARCRGSEDCRSRRSTTGAICRAEARRLLAAWSR